MKPFVFTYCEGTETKLVVMARDKYGIKILRTVAVETPNEPAEMAGAHAQVDDIDMEQSSGEITFDALEKADTFKPSAAAASGPIASDKDISHIASSLYDINLNNSRFIPVLTEPVLNYHIYEGERSEDKKKLIDAILTDIQEHKGFAVNRDQIDITELNGKYILGVFVENEIPCVNMINLLAQYNGKRYYYIPTIKSAELALAYHVSKTNKFYPEDYSLIIYTGKEYSKLIFMEGQRLKHIGSTLDMGTDNLQTYDVYFSKILLEMENGGIPRLDNVILCGEDNSENLVLSFYGTFPEANVTELGFDGVDTTNLEDEEKERLTGFAIPIAAGMEYFAELDKEYQGINILPKYIQENQKILQFGWHSYAILPLLFGATFFFTYQMLANNAEITRLDKEINRLTVIQQQNQEIIEMLNPLSEKIANFDRTQAILDSATVGTGEWGDMLDKVSSFVERRRNFWITKLETLPDREIQLSGYSLSRSSLTEFADYNNSSLLKNIMYEPLREHNAFAYKLKFKLAEKDSAAGAYGP